MAHHVVQHQRLDLIAFHLAEEAAHVRELRSRIERALRIAPAGRSEVVVEDLVAIDHRALTSSRAKRVERDVRRDARSPRLQAAHPRERVARERRHDLLEGLLDEIVVIRAPLADDPEEGLVDDAEEPVVNLRRYVIVTSTDRFDQGLV